MRDREKIALERKTVQTVIQKVEDAIGGASPATLQLRQAVASKELSPEEVLVKVIAIAHADGAAKGEANAHANAPKPLL